MAFTSYMSGTIEVFERPGQKHAPVVMLLHGIGSNASSFDLILAHLPDDWRVIAWNAPGYGCSEPLRDVWPVAADYAHALLGLYDRLGLSDPVLVGHSLGTLIGASFAAKHPDRIARLMLASPALGHGVTVGESLSTAAQNRIDDLERLGASDFAKARAARLVANADQNVDVVARVCKGMSQVQNPGYSQAVHMLASGRLLEDAAKISCVTNVLVGADDVVTPPASAIQTHEMLAASIQGDLTQLPAVGHAIYQQFPTGFARALHDLVAPITCQPEEG